MAEVRLAVFGPVKTGHIIFGKESTLDETVLKNDYLQLVSFSSIHLVYP